MKIVGLMPGLSSTVLGVLTIVGEYTVDSSEKDLTILSDTCKILLSDGEDELFLLADLGDG